MNSAKSICIVTPDLVGIVRNGGIGTACTELAYVLSNTGHNVKVLFSQVGAQGHGNELIDQVKTQYASQGVALTIAEEWAGATAQASVFPDHPQLRMSHIVHNWLKGQRFDFILFMDWQGNGFYALSARRAGLAHCQHGAVGIVCHSPTLWSDLGNSARRRNPVDALTYFIERRSIEMADVVVTPSHYLIDWMRRHGYRLPQRTLVQPNLLTVKISASTGQPPQEVVFFGRLEYRKGIVQFCAAIDRLIARGKVPSRIIFLGKMSFVADEHAAVYLARRTRDWPMPVEIVNRLAQPEALRFLTMRQCLAVVPSTEENSPYTVYECLTAGIPVIARNIGGIAELYAAEFRVTHLFGDNPSDLADRIAAALAGKLGSARLSFSSAENVRAWTTMLPALALQIAEERRSVKISPPQALVSVCLVHFQRPKLLMQALRSLTAQAYSNLEVVLVDDGSPDSETVSLLDDLECLFAERNWQIIRVSNGYVGRARNIAARHARGEYLLFMDDDNVANPLMVESLISGATACGADIVTSFASVFEGLDEPSPDTSIIETYLPVGGALGYALAGNAISDTNALIKRSLFEKLGGFTEDYGLGHEDFELFLRAVLQGADILVVPEALYWYRRQRSSMISATPHAANRARSLRPFLDHLGPDMAELLVVAHGMVDASALTAPPEDTEGMEGEEAVLGLRDPDSWQSIDAAAAIIATRGAVDLARQLLLQLPASTPGWELRRLRMDAISAAAAGDRYKLLASLQASQCIGDTASRDVLSLSARVAWRQRQPLAVDLLLNWARMDVEGLEPRLLLVDALDEKGRIGDAVGSFIDALKVADSAYRVARPDVDAAICRGDFGMGLVHYERHGRHENAPWPRAATFRRLAERLATSLENRCLAGPLAFISIAQLGFAAFAPEHKVALTVQDATLAGESL